MADAVRLELWQAMSELYLDTEVRPSIPRIARTCAETGYDDGLLDHVFWNEVNPVLFVNLMSVAGEWAGFTDEWSWLIAAYVDFGPHGEPGVTGAALRAIYDEDLAALLPTLLVSTESRQAAAARIEEALT